MKLVLKKIKGIFKNPALKKYADLNFSYNHPLTLQVSYSQEDYASYIFDYNEAEMVIVLPHSKETGTPLHLKTGELVTLTLPYNTHAYTAKARVKEIVRRGQLLITLAMPACLEEKQLRQFFRLPVEIPLSYAPVLGPQLRDGDFISSRSVDLSAGGAKFIVFERYHKGALLYVKFDIFVKEAYSILLTSRVIRMEESLTKGILAAVEFTDISKKEQELLIEYLNIQQLKYPL